jgi:hypothetical protein
MSKCFFWDGEKGILVKEGRPICKVVRKHNHWLLEYNPLPADTTIPTRVGPETYSTIQSETLEDTSESTDDQPHIEQQNDVNVQDTVPQSRMQHRKPIRRSVAIPKSNADMTT